MIVETQPGLIVLQLTDELFAQLQPFLAGLEMTSALCSALAKQGNDRQWLTMPQEIYAALVERVGDALDYDVCWQPNEYEPDGFVERVRPLELSASFDQSLATPHPSQNSACELRSGAQRS